AKKVASDVYTKSSIMVGLGETLDEVRDTMRALREVDVDVLTLGQYLRPTPKHHEVVRYVHPEEFAQLREDGMAMGFRYVASGPLVRSSYRAAEAFLRGLARRQDPRQASSTADAIMAARAEEIDIHEAKTTPRHRSLPVVT